MDLEEITQEVVRDVLDYSPETGAVSWKERPRKYFQSDGDWRRWNTRHGGRPTGRLDGYGYYQVRMLGNFILVHRLAWLYMYGRWPENQIDHINRDRADNRIANLREATNRENSQNRAKKIKYGIRFDPARGMWRTAIWYNNKRRHLGHFHDWFDAICARKSAENRIEHLFNS